MEINEMVRRETFEFSEYQKSPNPDQSWSALLVQLSADLDTPGVAYLWKIPNGQGQVIELRRLDPKHTAPSAILREGYLAFKDLDTPDSQLLKIPLSEVKVFRKEQVERPGEQQPVGVMKAVHDTQLQSLANRFTDAELASVGLTRYKYHKLEWFVGHLRNGLDVLENMIHRADSGFFEAYPDVAKYIQELKKDDWVLDLTDEQLASVGLMRIKTDEEILKAAREAKPNGTEFGGMVARWPDEPKQPPPPDPQLPRGGYF